TGLVFEVFDRGGKERALAGGGRYDALLEVMSDGKVKMPALGFGMGDVVLANMLSEIPAAKARRDAWLAKHRPAEIYVIIADDTRRAEALGLTNVTALNQRAETVKGTFDFVKLISSRSERTFKPAGLFKCHRCICAFSLHRCAFCTEHCVDFLLRFSNSTQSPCQRLICLAETTKNHSPSPNNI
ncbi:MAG: hypothetical protein EB015_21230, partial [Methylocystaceae bacterium]|nr:hypothetical protein [Methylocystaceae bacterium]